MQVGLSIQNIKNKKIQAFCDLDLDGTTCKLVFDFVLPLYTKDFRIEQTKINDVDFLKEQMEWADILLFADLAPQKETHEWLINQGKIVYIFDHHFTTRQLLGDLPLYIYDKERCGAKILYDFFKEDLSDYPSLGELVTYVNARDLFLTHTDEFHKGTWLHAILFKAIRPFQFSENQIIGYNKFVQYQKQKIISNPLAFFFFRSEVETGKAFEKALKESLKKARSTLKKRVDSLGRKYLYFEIGAKVSDIAHVFLSEMEWVDYIVIHNIFKKGEQRFSLRSREGGVDVSKIASLYKGGGHQPAAGLEIEDPGLFEDFRLGRKHFV